MDIPSKEQIPDKIFYAAFFQETAMNAAQYFCLYYRINVHTQEIVCVELTTHGEDDAATATKTLTYKAAYSDPAWQKQESIQPLQQSRLQS